MSSLLEQAIIDAKILKETAQKNAEAALLEKYKDKIKQNIEILLEQDDASLDADPLSDPLSSTPTEEDIPPTVPDLGSSAETIASQETKKFVEKVKPAYLGEDNLQEVEINLDSIMEKIDALEKDLNVKAPDFTVSAHEEVIAHSNPTHAPAIDGLAENIEIEQEEDSEQLEEELVIDLENVKPGGINSNEIELKKQYNIAKALEAQNEELNEELNRKFEELDQMEVKLTSALSRLQDTRGKLKKTVQLNTTLKESIELISKKAKEVNLLNSRLLYTNKALMNSSLNERQKKQIAESISKAKSVDEARTIYETLQRSAETVAPKRQVPQSLTEAINRSPSAFLPRTNNTIDPVRDRWQHLAGIASKK